MVPLLVPTPTLPEPETVTVGIETDPAADGLLPSTFGMKWLAIAHTKPATPTTAPATGTHPGDPSGLPACGRVFVANRCLPLPFSAATSPQLSERAQRLECQRGRPCRQGIAAVVGNRVVDLLEAVKVDEQQAKLGRGMDQQRVDRDLRGQPVRQLG